MRSLCQILGWGLLAVSLLAAEDPPFMSFYNPPAQPLPLLSHRSYASAVMKTRVGYNIYLPPGYADSTDRYPVIYWLHGRGCSESNDQFPAPTVDAAIRAGTIPPLIFVYASGGGMSFYSDSFDGQWMAETTLIKELIPHIDAQFRTIAERGGRAIQGMSMGGFGAMKLACKYPNLFGSVVAFAGGYRSAEGIQADEVSRRILEKVFGNDTGRFMANHPATIARANAEAIRDRIGIKMLVGLDDYLLENNRALHATLTELTIPHEYSEIPGVKHDLPRLSAWLGSAGLEFAVKYFDKPTATGRELLFAAGAAPRRLQTFSVAGLNHDVHGTVYGPGVLEQGGMPLGGVGTGYLDLDPDGRFGKASIFNRFPSPIALDQPFLELVVGERRLVLATPKAGVGAAKTTHYFGHFPVADLRFELEEPLAVELRAFSPFLPGDALDSGTPAAVFEVVVRNLSVQTQSVALAFSPGGFPAGETERFTRGKWSGLQTRHAPLERLPAWIRHSYAIAVEDGAADTNAKSARVSAPRELGPKQSTVCRFLLTWHQPYLREASGRVERHLYATRFADARDVMTHAMDHHADWRRRVLAWQDVLYSSDLPGWLQEALINAPYALTKNSVRLAKTRPDDWWGEDGLFLMNESFSTCALTETMPCRYFGHWPALFFFPDLELSTLRAIQHFQLRDGEPPFCLGVGFAIREPRYHCQHPAGAGEFAQLIQRYYLRTGNADFLRQFWPSARDALNFMLWLDRDQDGLVEDHPHNVEGETFPANNPLDNWPWHGASSYTAGKGLASLVCGIQLAEQAGDTAQAAQWRRALERGQKAYEEKLWTGSYYRTYHDTPTGRRNDSSFAAQLSGIWGTRVLGLADALPRDRVAKALETIARLNLPASPFGMVDAVNPDGTPCVEGGGSGLPDTVWSRDIFIQCNATAAMVFLYHGQRELGEAAAKPMLDTIFRGPHPMPWAQPCGLNAHNGRTCHGHDYYDHMVVWSYPLAFYGQDIRAICAPGGLVQKILAAANP